MTAETPVHPVSDAVDDASAENPREAPASPAASTGYVDLAAMILGVDEAPGATRLVEDDEHIAPREEFGSVLSRFRARLHGVSVADARWHLDMGMAYRTMGLGAEAIAEFQRAIRENSDSPGPYEMLGRCFLDAGQPGLAAGSLALALELPSRNEDRLLGIYYYLGRAHEALGEERAALECYRKIVALDIDFRDVAARFDSLGEAAAQRRGKSAGDARSGPPRADSPAGGSDS